LKALFLIKKNDSYGSSYSYSSNSSGLYNSAKFLVASLIDNKIIDEAALEICTDGNCLDRELTKHKPDVCVVEALWVTPDKLKEVQALHKKVRFVVRLHSNIPFLAGEGIAMEWIRAYEKINKVFISFNNERTNGYFKEVVDFPIYLPNIYPLGEKLPYVKKHGVINIGCFGAIRPLKNQLVQAVAALGYAARTGSTIRFHINATRVEQAGDSSLKNIRALFADTPHELIEHGWMEHDKFLEIIRQMNIGLQVSFTESFNIVTADFVASSIPIIVSKDITWMSEDAMATTTDVYDIEDKISKALQFSEMYAEASYKNLFNYNTAAINAWRKVAAKLF
jgi:hypothetical protein